MYHTYLAEKIGPYGPPTFELHKFVFDSSNPKSQVQKHTKIYLEKCIIKLTFFIIKIGNIPFIISTIIHGK